MRATSEIQSDRKTGANGLFKTIIGIAGTFFIIWCVMTAKEFLIPLCAASLLAMLMAPVTEFLKNKARLGEKLAVTLTVILLYLPLIGLASLVLIEADSLVKNWPTIYASAKQSLDHFMTSTLFAGIRPADYVDLSELQSKVTDRAGEGAVLLLAGLQTLFAAGTSAVLVLTFATIMLLSRDHLRRSVERILAIEESPEKAMTLENALGVLQKFLVARVLIIIFVAVTDFIILKLFGVPYAVTLAVILGISTLIPVIGFFVGIVPPLIVAASFGHSVLYLGMLCLALGAVSSAQDHLLTPALIGRKLNLNFLATYFAIFAGEQMWGLWGMFLAIPALGLLRVLLSASNDLKPWAKLLAEEDADPVTPQIKPQIKPRITHPTSASNKPVDLGV